MNFLRSIFSALLFAVVTVSHASPIKMVIPFPPGGGSDWQAQHLAKWLKETRDIDSILVHKPGAEGVIGARELNTSKKDGTTIGIFNIASLSKTREEFEITPVSALRQTATILVVRPDLAVKDYDDLISKMRTTSFNIGSAGGGQNALWTQIKSNERIATEQVMVNYKGGSHVAVGIAGGHVDVAMLAADIARDYIASGKVRALAMSFPVEGIDGVVLERRYPSWVDFSGLNLVLPSEVAPEVQKRWVDIVTAYLTDPTVLRDFKRLSSQPFKIGPDQLNNYVNRFDELLK